MRNNKGFTLVEVLIAMSILSVVIFLGNTVIVKSKESVNNQQETFNEQQSANLINKYMSRDLENTKIDSSLEPVVLSGDVSISEDGSVVSTKSNEKEYSYKYELGVAKSSSETQSVVYTVEVKNDEFSLYRNDGEVNLPVVEKVGYSQTDKAPIYIEEESDGIYMINSLSEGNEYQFKVSTRLTEVDGSSGGNDGNDGNGGGGDSFTVGSLILEKESNNSTSVTVNEKDESGNDVQKIKAISHEGKNVDIYIDSNIVVNANGESWKLQVNSKKYNLKDEDRIEIDGNTYLVNIDNTKDGEEFENTLEIKLGNKDILSVSKTKEVEREDGKKEVEIELEVTLLEDDINEVEIKIETEDEQGNYESEAEVSIGQESDDDTYSLSSKDDDNDEESEFGFEIRDTFLDEIVNVEFKAVGTLLAEVNDKDVSASIINCTKDELEYEESMYEGEAETPRLRTGEKIIINFTK